MTTVATCAHCDATYENTADGKRRFRVLHGHTPSPRKE